MSFLHTAALAEQAQTLACLLAAFVLGTLIGAERQYRQRTAGLRTTVLVAVGAAGFVDLGMRLGGAEGAVRVIAYVVSGIGFLGAGVIMKEGRNIRGLNTAATLWGAAAVGACAGAGMMVEAIVVTLAVLSANTLLRPLVNAINRIPVDERATEATYTVRVRAVSDTPELPDAIIELLDSARFPVAELTIAPTGDGVEIAARLMTTSVHAQELDAVVDRLARLPGARHATWVANTAG
ncbi:Protein MgtC [Rhodovastum atsumiense]|uniref:Protein MgtC n=1 Tax=Rhodovastum atsumiense TaxID=504468 RepID=A0A5M6J0M0_9PROT|nr:MgtC/SapB family protein [Rhodovastum atsumiense]KAA5613185.1 MgtC/SapB family protein [Rhodovastum atsumiense]CAH2600663.1 Protein MgtC [Rhodovastum atsumiense]